MNKGFEFNTGVSIFLQKDCTNKYTIHHFTQAALVRTSRYIKVAKTYLALLCHGRNIAFTDTPKSLTHSNIHNWLKQKYSLKAKSGEYLYKKLKLSLVDGRPRQKRSDFNLMHTSEILALDFGVQIIAQCCAVLLWWGRVRFGHYIWYIPGYIRRVFELKYYSLIDF